MTPSPFKFINLSYLELMADNDPGMRRTMLQMLLEELPYEIEKMNHFCSVKDWVELQEVAHKMKSTLAFVGNREMTQANKLIEEQSKARESLETLPVLLKQLNHYAEAAIGEIRIALEAS